MEANWIAAFRFLGMSSRSELPATSPFGSVIAPSRCTKSTFAHWLAAAFAQTFKALPPMSATIMIVSLSAMTSQLTDPVSSDCNRNGLGWGDRRCHLSGVADGGVKLCDKRREAGVGEFAS